jgi:tellurite resistance protein TehA-like permease
MGAGAMFGIIVIIALLTWGICKFLRGKQKINPEPVTPGLLTSSAPLKSINITTPGIEDLETKLPSEDNMRKPNNSRMVL